MKGSDKVDRRVQFVGNDLQRQKFAISRGRNRSHGGSFHIHGLRMEAREKNVLAIFARYRVGRHQRTLAARRR